MKLYQTVIEKFGTTSAVWSGGERSVKTERSEISPWNEQSKIFYQTIVEAIEVARYTEKTKVIN